MNNDKCIRKSALRGKTKMMHEIISMMDNCETLLCMYHSLGMPQCRSIVLYSWLFSCLHCSQDTARFYHQSYV